MLTGTDTIYGLPSKEVVSKKNTRPKNDQVFVLPQAFDIVGLFNLIIITSFFISSCVVM